MTRTTGALAVLPLILLFYTMLLGQSALEGVRVSGRVIGQRVQSPLEDVRIDTTVTLAPEPSMRSAAVRAALGETAGGLGAMVPTRAGNDGSFQFSKVKPGVYTLNVDPSSMVPVTIVVGETDVSGIELRVPAAVAVHGKVVLNNMNTAWSQVGTGFELLFTPYEGGRPPKRSISGDVFGAELSAGSYQVGWSGLPAGYSIKSIVSGGADLLAGPLRIREAAVPEVVVTLDVASPPPWGKVSGRVTGTLPQTKLLVTLPGLYKETELRPDGSFEFYQVPTGKAYVMKLDPPFGTTPQAIFVGNGDLTNVIIAIPGRE